MLVVVLVLENPDRFAIRLTEQISLWTSVSLRSRNPNAPRTSTTTRTISNFGILENKLSRRSAFLRVAALADTPTRPYADTPLPPSHTASATSATPIDPINPSALRTTLTCSPSGAQTAGSVAPNNTTVGVPTAAAR